MTVLGMTHFEEMCKKKLAEWYNENMDTKITTANTFTVWSCKALQNYKCLVSTSIDGDGIYAEYTYNGDRQELYEDVYKKCSNRCIKE